MLVQRLRNTHTAGLCDDCCVCLIPGPPLRQEIRIFSYECWLSLLTVVTPSSLVSNQPAGLPFRPVLQVLLLFRVSFCLRAKTRAKTSSSQRQQHTLYQHIVLL